MFAKGLKICILSAMMSAAAAFTATAASSADAGTGFPYDIEFDVEAVDRVCYAGHPGNTVCYKDGVAVTPDTMFRLVPNENNAASESGTQSGDVSVTVSLVYENDDNSGSYKEVVKKYDSGDVNCEDDYRLLSDNTITSLEDRDKLYSDMLTGMELTVTAKGRDSKKKTIYLYVCDDVYDIADTSESEE